MRRTGLLLHKGVPVATRLACNPTFDVKSTYTLKVTKVSSDHHQVVLERTRQHQDVLVLSILCQGEHAKQA